MSKFRSIWVLALIIFGAGFISACSQPKTNSADAQEIIAAEVPLRSAVDAYSDLPEPILAQPAGVLTAAAANSKQLVLADFNTADKPNNLGGDFGAWNKDPDDATQGCFATFEPDDALRESAGYSLRLDYDVDSENPAYNGFWMKLNGLDASAYGAISFYARGEGHNNYTKRIKIEIKDSSNRPSPYMINGVSGAWQKFEIPFERFRKVQNWAALSEFVVVFDDMNSDPKQGTLLIDQITLEKK